MRSRIEAQPVWIVEIHRECVWPEEVVIRSDADLAGIDSGAVIDGAIIRRPLAILQVHPVALGDIVDAEPGKIMAAQRRIEIEIGAELVAAEILSKVQPSFEVQSAVL